MKAAPDPTWECPPPQDVAFLLVEFPNVLLGVPFGRSMWEDASYITIPLIGIVARSGQMFWEYVLENARKHTFGALFERSWSPPIYR